MPQKNAPEFWNTHSQTGTKVQENMPYSQREHHRTPETARSDASVPTGFPDSFQDVSLYLFFCQPAWDTLWLSVLPVSVT
jgi:hypothetical protein